ncbi:MAG TPA: universal stress protein [Ktedonobacteraceae bacterium]|nr:universal stress protein [Ktedonobacteraceae bacterium]
MFRRLLVPLDGSPAAERAIPVAASLVRRSAGSLVLLHIIAPETALKSTIASSSSTADLHGDQKEISYTEAIERVMAEAAIYLTTLPIRYAEELAGLSVEMDIAFGMTSPTLPSTVRIEHIDLVVLCRDREVGLDQWGLESVTQHMMRQSPVPLLILNKQEKQFPVLDGSCPVRILVPLDGSLFAEAALEPALKLLAQCTGSELCLLHVVDLFMNEPTEDEEERIKLHAAGPLRQQALRYLQAVAERLRTQAECGSDVHITCLVTSGADVANSILKLRALATTSELTTTSFIALATHGREGIQRQAVGSIAEQLLCTTTSPLLTICPGAAATERLQSLLPAKRRN